MTTLEHVSRYLAQLGEASVEEAHRVRFFPLSLSRLVFSWFSSLEPNSITRWADLEHKFHAYFYSGTGEKKISDLMNMRQRNNELGYEFIQRFRQVKSHCYSLNLSEGQLAKLALQGMLPAIKEKFKGQEFENLSHLIQRVSAFESPHRTRCREKYLKGDAAIVDPYVADSNEDENPEVIAIEWTWGKAPISCP